MDKQDECTVETATGTHKCHRFIKKALEFLVLASVVSYLYSSFSGSGFFLSHNVEFSTLIFPLLAHALDRKYMFLICNGILAFLAKNLRFSSSGLHHSGFTSTAEGEDDVKQMIMSELPSIAEEVKAQENVVAVEEEEEMVLQEERDYVDVHKSDEEIRAAGIIVSENQDWEFEEEEEDDDELLKQNGAAEGSTAAEEVNDASVNTEELNQKFEEFIRRMKEEIRIQAQQQLVTAAASN